MVDKTRRLINTLKKQTVQVQTPISTDMFMPNHSGVASHPEFKKEMTDLATEYLKLDCSNDPLTNALEIRASVAAQLTIAYDLANHVTISVNPSGEVEFTATGAEIDFTNNNLQTTGNIIADSDSKGLVLGADQDLILYNHGSDGFLTIQGVNQGVIRFGTSASGDNVQFLKYEDSGTHLQWTQGASMGTYAWENAVSGKTPSWRWYGYPTSEYLSYGQVGMVGFAYQPWFSIQTSGYGVSIPEITRIGGTTTNYFQINATGNIQMIGSARITWGTKRANSLTLTAGISIDGVGDLDTPHDGNFYHIDEVAATPGLDMYVEFTNIDAFNWVSVKGVYTGKHSVAIQLYDWRNEEWHTFGSFQKGVADVTTADGYIFDNEDFIVVGDANYIGTSLQDGKVRVRFYHTAAGNASEDLYLSYVGLLQ